MLHLWEICENYLEIARFSDSPSTQSEHIWKERGTITFDVITDLDPDLFVERDPFFLWYFRGRVKVTHSTAHYPLRLGAAGVFFLSKCSAYWWIEIHVSQFRYDNPRYLASNSHLFLPHNSSLSLRLFSLRTFALPPSSTICSLPHVSYLFAPYPPTSTTLISSYSPLSPPSPPFLHLLPCPARNCWN